jgi:hypothetical protein
VSNPALKSVGRIALVKVPTPVPRTLGRLELLLGSLADADARIYAAFKLLEADAAELGRADWPAFAARVNALLLDIDTAKELIVAILPLSKKHECFVQERAERLGEKRIQARRWLREVGAI